MSDVFAQETTEDVTEEFEVGRNPFESWGSPAGPLEKPPCQIDQISLLPSSTRLSRVQARCDPHLARHTRVRRLTGVGRPDSLLASGWSERGRLSILISALHVHMQEWDGEVATRSREAADEQEDYDAYGASEPRHPIGASAPSPARSLAHDPRLAILFPIVERGSFGLRHQPAGPCLCYCSLATSHAGEQLQQHSLQGTTGGATILLGVPRKLHKVALRHRGEGALLAAGLTAYKQQQSK